MLSIMITILDLKLKMIEREGNVYDHSMSTRSFTLIMKKIFI